MQPYQSSSAAPIQPAQPPAPPSPSQTPLAPSHLQVPNGFQSQSSGKPGHGTSLPVTNTLAASDVAERTGTNRAHPRIDITRLRCWILVTASLLVPLAWYPSFTNASSLRWPLLFLTTALVGRPSLALLWLIWPAVTLAWTPSPIDGAWSLLLLAVLITLYTGSIGNQSIALWAVGVSLITGFIWNTKNFGGFINPDLWAEPAAIIVIWIAVKRKYLGAIILAIPVLISRSRISLTAIFIGFLCDRHLRLTIAPLIVIPTIVACFGPGKMFSLGERWQIWRTTLTQLTPFGHGIGSFLSTYPKWQYAHSDVIQMMYEVGYVYMVIVAGSGIWWLHRQLYRLSPQRGIDQHEDRGEGGGDRAATRSALAGLGIEIVVGFPLHAPVTILLAALLLGHLIVGCRQQYQSGDGVYAAV